MTSDLNAIFGHRPIYTRGEAATFIPNSSFLIPNSRKAYIHNQWTEPPHGLTLRRFYIFMRRTTISHFSFLISHSSEAFKRNQGTALLIPNP